MASYCCHFKFHIEHTTWSGNFLCNGVQLPAITCISGTTQTANTGTIQPISFGRIHDGPIRFFNGQLDDFYLYNRVLSPTEVMQLYTASPCTVAILAINHLYWHDWHLFSHTDNRSFDVFVGFTGWLEWDLDE